MSLFTDEQTHPLILLRALTAKYGVDWMEWGPTVLRRTVEHDFPDGVSKVNLAKALAGAVVATRDEFWESWPTFLFLAQALNGHIPVVGSLVELSVGEMMVAVDVASHIRSDLGDLAPAPPFSDEVTKFVAATALQNGVWYLPPPLDFAAAEAAGKSYRCKSCGNTGPVVFEDGVCDACSGRFEDGGLSQLTSWRPDPRYLKGAKNVEYFEKNPTDRVRARFEQVLNGKDITLQETQADVCVARLLVAYNYMAERRDQLKQQAEAA